MHMESGWTKSATNPYLLYVQYTAQEHIVRPDQFRHLRRAAAGPERYRSVESACVDVTTCDDIT
jgi:hypothetical protein